MDKGIFKKIKKEHLLIAVLIVGIIFLSSGLFTNKEQTTVSQKTETELFVESLETKLEEALGKIEGVKKPKVVVTVDGGIKQIYQADEKSVEENGVATKTKTTVFSGGKPILIGSEYPSVTGVLIVCGGADDVRVKMNVLSATRTILNVSLENVSVISSKK